MWLIHHGSFQDQVSVQPDTCPPFAARAWPTWLAGMDRERVQALSEPLLPAIASCPGAQLENQIVQKGLNLESLPLQQTGTGRRKEEKLGSHWAASHQPWTLWLGDSGVIALTHGLGVQSSSVSSVESLSLPDAAAAP